MVHPFIWFLFTLHRLVVLGSGWFRRSCTRLRLPHTFVYAFVCATPPARIAVTVCCRLVTAVGSFTTCATLPAYHARFYGSVHYAFTAYARLLPDAVALLPVTVALRFLPVTLPFFVAFPPLLVVRTLCTATHTTWFATFHLLHVYLPFTVRLPHATPFGWVRYVVPHPGAARAFTVLLRSGSFWVTGCYGSPFGLPTLHPLLAFTLPQHTHLYRGCSRHLTLRCGLHTRPAALHLLRYGSAWLPLVTVAAHCVTPYTVGLLDSVVTPPFLRLLRFCPVCCITRSAVTARLHTHTFGLVTPHTLHWFTRSAFTTPHYRDTVLYMVVTFTYLPPLPRLLHLRLPTARCRSYAAYATWLPLLLPLPLPHRAVLGCRTLLLTVLRCRLLPRSRLFTLPFCICLVTGYGSFIYLLFTCHTCLRLLRFFHGSGYGSATARCHRVGLYFAHVFPVTAVTVTLRLPHFGYGCYTRSFCHAYRLYVIHTRSFCHHGSLYIRLHAVRFLLPHCVGSGLLPTHHHGSLHLPHIYVLPFTYGYTCVRVLVTFPRLFAGPPAHVYVVPGWLHRAVGLRLQLHIHLPRYGLRLHVTHAHATVAAVVYTRLRLRYPVTRLRVAVARLRGWLSVTRLHCCGYVLRFCVPRFGCYDTVILVTLYVTVPVGWITTFTFTFAVPGLRCHTTPRLRLPLPVTFRGLRLRRLRLPHAHCVTTVAPLPHLLPFGCRCAHVTYTVTLRYWLVAAVTHTTPFWFSSLHWFGYAHRYVLRSQLPLPVVALRVTVTAFTFAVTTGWFTHTRLPQPGLRSRFTVRLTRFTTYARLHYAHTTPRAGLRCRCVTVRCYITFGSGYLHRTRSRFARLRLVALRYTRTHRSHTFTFCTFVPHVTLLRLRLLHTRLVTATGYTV